MSVFNAVDAEAATKAKEVLTPFRTPAWEKFAGEIVLNLQRADRLEQAIAEAIHAAANRPNHDYSAIPSPEYRR